MTAPGSPQPESRFVLPDDRCPCPERWTSTDGDSTEIEVTEMLAGMVRGLQPWLVVETGAAHGQTTMAIAGALDRNDRGHLVTYEVDPRRRAELPPHSRVTVRESSLDADLDGLGPIDFAFLDSWPELRVPEFLHLRQWMRVGTIVAFHDTRPAAGAHRIASGRSLRDEIATELVRAGVLGVIDLPTPRGLTLGEVL